MANGTHPKLQLTTISAKAKGPGRHLDGDGLYLVVDPGGARRWVLRIVVGGRRVDMGLGGFNRVPLAMARTKAAFTTRRCHIAPLPPSSSIWRRRKALLLGLFTLQS